MRIALLTALVTKLHAVPEVNPFWVNDPFLFTPQSYPINTGKTGIAAARREAKRRRRAKI